MINESVDVKEYAFLIVAISEEDHITIHQYTGMATDRDDAERKYLEGNFDNGGEVGEMEHPYYDVSRGEYILSTEPLNCE